MESRNDNLRLRMIRIKKFKILYDSQNFHLKIKIGKIFLEHIFKCMQHCNIMIEEKNLNTIILSLIIPH